jgi:hypothetical protein
MRDTDPIPLDERITERGFVQEWCVFAQMRSPGNFYVTPIRFGEDAIREAREWEAILMSSHGGYYRAKLAQKKYEQANAVTHERWINNPFPVLSITRQDFIDAGFDASEVSDARMEHLAGKILNSIAENLSCAMEFWAGEEGFNLRRIRISNES